MKVKEVSIEEYKKLLAKMMGNSQITRHNISSEMINVIVPGSSGPGTPFANEYERLIYEWRNLNNKPITLIIYDDAGEACLIKANKNIK